jgi:hypothetical protein
MADSRSKGREMGRHHDRRSRYRNDPSMQVGISLPVILKQQLDDAAIARRSTISGIMRQGVVEWLERHANETELEPDTHLDDAR